MTTWNIEVTAEERNKNWSEKRKEPGREQGSLKKSLLEERRWGRPTLEKFAASWLYGGRGTI